jgi:hypothetical protein
MGVLAGALLIGVTAALAPANASAPGGKTFNIKVPLPAPRHGSVTEYKASIALSAGARITGLPFLGNVTNRTAVPSYIRSVAGFVPKGPGKWDVFIFVNAPKGLVGGRNLSSSSASTLNLQLQTTPLPSSWTVSLKPVKGDKCKVFKAEERDVIWLIFIAASEGEAPAVAKFTMAADSRCR